MQNINSSGEDCDHQQLEHIKGLTIVSLNVNGLRSHLDEVKSLIYDNGIHILALNETKLSPEYHKELTKIEGYRQTRLDRTASGGGVALYIMDSLKYTWRNDLPIKDLELICVEIEPPKSKSYLLVAWYRSPSDPVDSFKKLERNLTYFDKEKK